MTRKIPMLLAAALLLAGCAQMNPPDPRANVVLAPVRGSGVTGSAQFIQHKHSVEVVGEVRGLQPNSEHGFHIHERGDCSGSDGKSAGPHFNPDAMPHGRFDMVIHHAGDLPSLHADGHGVASFRFESKVLQVGIGSGDALTRALAITAGPGDLVGRALIVDRDPDDFTTQPSGNSGPPLACGVITAG